MDEVLRKQGITEVNRASYREYRQSKNEFLKKLSLYKFLEHFVNAEKHGNVRPVTERKMVHWCSDVKKMAPSLMMTDIDDNKEILQWLLDQYGYERRRNTVLDFKNFLYNALRYAESEHVIEHFNNYGVNVHSIEDRMNYNEQSAIKNAKKSLSRSEFDKMNNRLLSEINKALLLEPDEKGYVVLQENKDVNSKAQFNFNVIDHVLIYLVMHTGLRFGEALGIKKTDIGTDKIKIERTWNYKDNPGHFDFTKNKSSIRNVPIGSTTYLIAKQYIMWLERYFGDVGENPIFVRKNLRTYNSTANYRLKLLMDRCEIDEKITIHKLRHTYISILLDQGISPETIAKCVGHTDASMINKVYGHVLEERKNEEIFKIKNIM